MPTSKTTAKGRRPPAPALKIAAADPPGVVTRTGRDGTTRKLRRHTIYLPLDVSTALEDRAHERRRDLSEVVAEALADTFGISLLEAAAE